MVAHDPYPYGTVGWWKTVLGLSWPELAAACGVDQSTVRRRAYGRLGKFDKHGAVAKIENALRYRSIAAGLGDLMYAEGRFLLLDPPEGTDVSPCDPDECRRFLPVRPEPKELPASPRMELKVTQEQLYEALSSNARLTRENENYARRLEELKGEVLNGARMRERLRRLDARCRDLERQVRAMPRPVPHPSRTVSPEFVGWVQENFPTSWRDQLRTPGRLWAKVVESATGVFTTEEVRRED